MLKTIELEKIKIEKDLLEQISELKLNTEKANKITQQQHEKVNIPSNFNRNKFHYFCRLPLFYFRAIFCAIYIIIFYIFVHHYSNTTNTLL